MKKSLQAYHTIVNMNRFGLFAIGLVLAVANGLPQSGQSIPDGCKLEYKKQFEIVQEERFREECEETFV